jgi:hypothetical protein
VVDGLGDVLDTATKEVKVDEVTFRTREKENVGTISLKTNNDSASANVEKEALYLIDKALGELCFAFNTEAQIKSDSLYICNLTHDPDHETVQGSLVLRWGYLREEPEQTLSKIALIPKEKKAVLDLALAYYKLSYYRNPVRIQTLFSCISVIIRNLIGNDYLKTPELKNQIRSIPVFETERTIHEIAIICSCQRLTYSNSFL